LRETPPPAIDWWIVTDTLDSLHTGTAPVGNSRRSVDIFTGWWLRSFGYALAALYVLYFVILYRAGTWIVNSNGLPIYTDFANAWAAGIQALHGNAAALYDPTELAKVHAALFGPTPFSYPNWPYPPTYFLFLAPFAAVPYCWAFITWELATLLGCVAVVYLIVRRQPAIALALAAPFTAWNFLAAQNGFLTASLMGAALLLLQCRPVAAGIFMGLLSYKPQFGILLPVALVASHQWRAVVSAAATIILLAGISIAAFGVGAWEAFPRQLLAQAGLSLLADPSNGWGYIQTVYGLIRSLHGDAALAWLAQGSTTLGAAVIVWLVWRSRAAYPIKAGTLSAAALLATPYAFAYDMAAILIPAAFLASDQLRGGLLRGDKTLWIALFGVPLAALVTLGDNVGGPTFGGMPVGLFAVILLLGMILRRAIVTRPIAAFSH
jgi:hypothetical protein